MDLSVAMELILSHECPTRELGNEQSVFTIELHCMYVHILAVSTGKVVDYDGEYVRSTWRIVDIMFDNNEHHPSEWGQKPDPPDPELERLIHEEEHIEADNASPDGGYSNHPPFMKGCTHPACIALRDSGDGDPYGNGNGTCDVCGGPIDYYDPVKGKL